MAQKLHETYGYSYDHLQVLLGGWSAWQAAGYPVATGAAPGAAPDGPAPTVRGAATPVVTLQP